MTYYIVGQALIQSDVEGSLNSPPHHPIVNVNYGRSLISGSHFAITSENRYIPPGPYLCIEQERYLPEPEYCNRLRGQRSSDRHI